MAIKINSTTVIDNSRNLTNINSIYANGSVGAASSVLISTGSGISWAPPSSVGGGSLSLASYFASNS